MDKVNAIIKALCEREPGKAMALLRSLRNDVENYVMNHPKPVEEAEAIAESSRNT
jgi:hypothetical protein